MSRKKQHIGSPTHQVKNALNRVFAPERSRHADKAAGIADRYIYSIRTMRAYVEDNTRFAKWVRAKYGVRDIRHIEPAHAHAYLDYLAAKERSGGYIGQMSAAIKKLSWALHGMRWDLGAGWHSDPRPERQYSPAGAQRIIADLRAHTQCPADARDKQVPEVVELQRIAGLRVQEAIQLRAPDVDVEQCAVRPDKGTKGGRPRTVAVDAAHQEYLRSLRERGERNNTDGQHVFRDRGRAGQGLDKRTQRAIAAACQRLGIESRGTHGFRGTFAQQRYREYRNQGLTIEQAAEKLTRDMGHGRVEVLKSYIELD